MTGPNRADWAHRLCVIEAGVSLSVAVAALRLLPFRAAARLLIGRPLPAQEMPMARTTETNVGMAPHAARQIAVAVRRAGDLLPIRALCLAQAIAGKRMLARRGYAATLHLSVEMGATTAAHAWLTLDGYAVIGGGAPPRQVEIARFS